jgi:hypothetical protein
VIKIDQQDGLEEMKSIVRLAYSLLCGGLLHARPRNSPTQIIMSDEYAKNVVYVFFNNMVGTVIERVRDLVENVELYNSSLMPAANAAVLDVGPAAPECLRPLVSTMSALGREDRKATVKYLQQNCRLVQFLYYWEAMRQSLVNMDEEGVQIGKYLQLPSPERGRTYVSLAKRAFLTKFGISSTRFDSYRRNGQSRLPWRESLGTVHCCSCPTMTAGKGLLHNHSLT